MKIKKIKKVIIGSRTFKVIWNKNHNGGSLEYGHKVKEPYIEIGTSEFNDIHILDTIMHELMELITLLMHVRFDRKDVNSDYMFVYDHRQHDTMMSMMAGAVSQFIQ